jgi:argininosuccinate lyase
MSKLWGGRFEGTTDEAVERLNNSLSFDRRLWRQDIEGSIAHATMLGECGIIAADEAREIVDGLASLRDDLESHEAELDPTQEDIHSAVESLLRERLGPVAGKLHTARSRNDQVATDTRLYLRDAILGISSSFLDLQRALVGQAEKHVETILPGTTHLQHAQPISLAHHLLAYFWMIQRDRERLAECYKRTNRLPLGAAALAGTPFPINRERVAELLGFDAVIENSLDAVSDRDFAMEFLSTSAIFGIHLSRLSEELILWSTPEYAYVELDDSVTTGSSIMPQKKNPDVAELARGKTGRLNGNLIALLTMMKGQPLTYNKDMQEDKEPLFDTVDTLSLLLPAVIRMIESARFKPERMAASLHGDFSTATDLADYLARKGVPFRVAHEVVGRVVRSSIEQGRGLEDIPVEELRALAPELADAPADLLTPQSSLRARNSQGGTAPDRVREQLALAKALL